MIRLRSRAPRASIATAGLIAAVFFVFHLPYLPRSLEDLDSINFALGVRHFDVAEHQPHPPGYPLYILAGKAARAVTSSEAAGLAAIGVVAGALGILAAAALFRRLDAGDFPTPAVATLLTATAPLYWFTAARPLSDMAGLALAIAVQALALAGPLLAASALAGLFAGFRSQVIWLTLPLVAFLVSREHSVHRGRLAVACLIAAAGGVLVWFIPLVALSGGPAGYWHALSTQGSEDLTNIQMLWTRPTPRELAGALYFAFVAPWARWDVAIFVLGVAAVGAARLRAEAAALVAAAFLPYFVFDVLFQETFTTRYALPLVVPIAYLAARGFARAGRRAGVLLAAALAAFNAHVGGTSVAAYARAKAPVFRLMDDMKASTPSLAEPPVLATDRREEFDLRRPITWLGADGPRFSSRLMAPPQHEWLEPVRYWNGGGRGPLWLVVDPRRAQIETTAHGVPAEYRWNVPYPILLGGIRPNEMDWYRFDRPPEWYVGEGWSLTPEIAGVTQLDRRGLENGPILGWVATETLGGTVVIGGRNFDATGSARLEVTLDGVPVTEISAPPAAAYVHVAALPAVPSSSDFHTLTISSSPPRRVAVEQFDASAHRPVLGFDGGWLEPEYDPALGLRWRWLSEKGELRVAAPRGAVLHLEGDSPLKYFSTPSRLVIRAGDRTLYDDRLSSSFALDIPIPAGVDRITLETDQVYVPAERSRRTQDRRHLGLRMFRCQLASLP